MEIRLPAFAALALASCAPSATGPTTTALGRVATTDELVRLRCALDGRQVVTTWTGDVHAVIPGERPRRLFGLVGMNIARCVRGAEGFTLTSRELLFYLDPRTGERLDQWTNPWEPETSVPVVHVANRLVQNPLLGPAPMTIADGVATVSFDVPVFYPNPLAADAETRPFSPEPSYQAMEMFTFWTPARELGDPRAATVASLSFTWHRTGPWLPWMAMKDRAGYLVYSARGRKLAGLDELPPLLRDEISTRLPLYADAPRCRVHAPNETSWTYFRRHVDAYRARARFPLPAPREPDECAATGPAASPR